MSTHTAYTVPDRQLDDPRQDEPQTPEEELDDGNVAACDAFYKWLTDPVNEVELYDFVMGQADSVVMRSLIKRWSERAQEGEV